MSENRKLYFYDLGIRNILVKDFRELDLRPDKGHVFENFVVSELEEKNGAIRMPSKPCIFTVSIQAKRWM